MHFIRFLFLQFMKTLFVIHCSPDLECFQQCFWLCSEILLCQRRDLFISVGLQQGAAASGPIARQGLCVQWLYGVVLWVDQVDVECLHNKQNLFTSVETSLRISKRKQGYRLQKVKCIVGKFYFSVLFQVDCFS